MSLQVGSAALPLRNKAKEEEAASALFSFLLMQSGHVPVAKKKTFMSKSKSVLFNAEGDEGQHVLCHWSLK